MLTPIQIRGARAMLSMTQSALAERAGISATALNSIERGASDPKASTLKAVQAALEAAGCIFIAENGEGPGVRLRKHGRGRAEVRILEEAARMFEADYPGMKFEGSTGPTIAGQETEILADPGQRAAYIAMAEQKLAEEGR